MFNSNKVILDLATMYSQAKGVSLSRISNLIFSQGTKIKQLQAGAGLTMKRYFSAIQWFADNWPSDLHWPEDLVKKPQTAAEKKAEYENSLLQKQAIELNADGILANPKIFCKVADISRDLLRQLIRNYGDGGKFQNKRTFKRNFDANDKLVPTSTEIALRMLVTSGDKRFSNFIASQQRKQQMVTQVWNKVPQTLKQA